MSLSNAGALTLRSTTFRVSNVKWGFRWIHRDSVVANNNARFQAFFTPYNNQTPRICSIAAFKTKGQGQARHLLIVVQNVEYVTNEAITQVFKRIFFPYRGDFTPIEIIAHSDLVQKLGYEPEILGDGYVDIPADKGMTVQDFEGVQGIWAKGLPLAQSANEVQVNRRKGYTGPVCNLCDCKNETGHEKGRRHRFFLGVLQQVKDLYFYGTQSSSVYPSCPICPGIKFKNSEDQVRHKSNSKHIRAMEIQKSFLESLKCNKGV